MVFIVVMAQYGFKFSTVRYPHAVRRGYVVLVTRSGLYVVRHPLTSNK